MRIKLIENIDLLQCKDYNSIVKLLLQNFTFGKTM